MPLRLSHLGLACMIALAFSTAHTELFGQSARKVASEVATLSEEYEVGGLEFSPDGKRLIVMAGAYSKTAHVWDWKNGKVIQTLDNAYVEPLVKVPARYSQDGRYLARCSNPVTIWDAQNWNVATSISHTLNTHAPGLTADAGVCKSLEFSPNGKLLIVVMHRAPQAEGHNIMAYDTATWELRWSLRTIPFYTDTISFSLDGRSVAIGGHVLNVKSSKSNSPPPTFGDPPFPDTGLIAILDVEKHTIVRTVPVPATYYESTHSVAWSPIDARIAFGAGDGLRLFDPHSGESIGSVSAERTGAKADGRFTPDGKYLIGFGFGEKGTKVRILDGSSYQVIQEISAKPKAMAISRDGRYVAFGGSAVSLTSMNPLLGLVSPAKGKVIVYRLQ